MEDPVSAGDLESLHRKTVVGIVAQTDARVDEVEDDGVIRPVTLADVQVIAGLVDLPHLDGRIRREGNPVGMGEGAVSEAGPDPVHALQREDGMDKLRAMTKAFMEDGGMEVQYNIVSADTMRAAQADPDAYNELVVRIAGFSAYFVELNKDCQNDLISRTENMLG